MESARIDGGRLWRSIAAMAGIGATAAGGVNRQTLTDGDGAARALFAQWCEAAGCGITVDRLGNIFARRPGRDNARPPVMTGSHLDTQPTGGRFDGAYGVLAGLEVVRTLGDRGIETMAPVEVVCWTNEEGCRFTPSMLGSGVFAGVYDVDYALARTDAGGRTVGDELARIGWAGKEVVGGRPVAAYFEAHIEQGPILEAEGRAIGAVIGGQGKRSYEITVRGQESHAGTTPMGARRDPLAAAARMVGEVQRLALDNGPDAVGTVGMISVTPNSRNTIPATALFSADLRHPGAPVLAAMDRGFRDACALIAGAGGVELQIDLVSEYPPTAFDPTCVAAVRDAARRLGHDPRDMTSGAGHDACYVSRVAPAAMIFIPCEDGISHAEIENATPQDCAAGCDVLLHAVLGMAGTWSRSEWGSTIRF